MVKFIIVTPGRSGSSHLQQTLHTSNQLEVVQELFNRSKNNFPSFNHYLNSKPLHGIFGTIFNRESISAWPRNRVLKYLINAYLEHFYLNNNDDVVGKGFRLTLDQIEAYPFVLDYGRDHGLKFIYLGRQDLLALTLSLLRARSENVYNSEWLEERSGVFEFDCSRVLEEVCRIKSREKRVLTFLFDQDIVKISYEQLFGNYESTLKEILTFLELEDVEIPGRSALRKINPSDLDEWVRNLDQIRAAVSTELEDYDFFAKPPLRKIFKRNLK